MESELIATMIQYAPAVGIMAWLIWRQQSLIDRLIEKCHDGKDDDESVSDGD